MFGGDLVHPKCHPTGRRNPLRQDILFPGVTPGYYQHVAREPNTNCHVQMLHYRQRKLAHENQTEKANLSRVHREHIEGKYEEGVKRKTLQRLIDDRVKEKMEAYEKTVEERRRKLQELLCKEECEYYRETVDVAQKGKDMKMQEMKLKAEKLRAQREAERLEIVRQKRIEQYKDRCQDIRPKLVKKHLIESKYGQLQQMRENEARREADREIDKLWYEFTMKELEAKKEREVQEMLERRDMGKKMLETWDKQRKGKDLLKKEVEEIEKEDRMQMQKLFEELKKEETEGKAGIRAKKQKEANELLEQIVIQEKIQTQRKKKEEDAIDQAFNNLAKLELDREEAAFKDMTNQARREAAMYRQHLKQLEEERENEEKHLAELMEHHRKEIEKKQDEAKCKVVEAKRKLQENVLAERAEQLRYKKQMAEEQLKVKQAENEILRMVFDTNERLQAESDRLEKMAVQQYRDDLLRQIQYNNELRKREKKELKRQLEEGKKEEAEYERVVYQMIKAEIQHGIKHPFRRALEQHDCWCPPCPSTQ